MRRGGTLMIYGVYDNAARVHWPPSKIFLDEIKVSAHPYPQFTCVPTYSQVTQIIGSFAQTHCFPRAVAYLDSGRIKVKGMVSVHHLVCSKSTAARLCLL